MAKKRKKDVNNGQLEKTGPKMAKGVSCFGRFHKQRGTNRKTHKTGQTRTKKAERGRTTDFFIVKSTKTATERQKSKF